MRERGEQGEIKINLGGRKRRCGQREPHRSRTDEWKLISFLNNQSLMGALIVLTGVVRSILGAQSPGGLVGVGDTHRRSAQQRREKHVQSPAPRRSHGHKRHHRLPPPGGGPGRRTRCAARPPPFLFLSPPPLFFYTRKRTR